MAAELGSLSLLGKSGRTYIVDVQCPDAVATQWTFNPTGAATATSPASYRVAEDVVITDFSVATGTTATGAVLNINGTAIPAQIRFANHLNTLAFRPALRIPVKAGDFIGAIQN